MKKIIFWGDGLLAGSSGYAELLSHHLFLHHPQAKISTSIFGGTGTLWQDVLREAPLHVIGKAPEFVVLGLGSADLAAGAPIAEIFQNAESALHLMLQKTQCRISLLSLIPSFFVEEIHRAASHSLNQRLRDLCHDRVAWVNLESRVDYFLNQHRQSQGEKHSLHFDSLRLTPLGRLFLAHHAFHLIDWPETLQLEVG